MYLGLGLTSVVFVSHGVLLHGWATQNDRMALEWLILVASLNVVGAAVYAARVPERWCPYKFDIYGASHQIFHVTVILAALAHHKGLLQSYEHLHRNGFSCET